MNEYRYKTNTTTFKLNITEPASTLPDAVLQAVSTGSATVGNPPELSNVIFNLPVRIAYGESWVEELVPYDEDNDIVTLEVIGLDPAKPYITYDKRTKIL